MPMRFVALVACLMGCAAASPRSGLPSPDRVVGCLEFRVREIADDTAADLGLVALDYEFANRCRAAVALDLSRMEVAALSAEGEARLLAAHDPRGEIRAGVLDGHSRGREVIGYGPVANAKQLCINLPDGTEALCFRRGAP
ncbi:MAG: hypothetical protein AAGE52_09930 [Myxococcota bacterium]